MTHSNDVVSARELAEAFGWGTRHLYEAQDPMEVRNVLIHYWEGLPKGALIKRSFITPLKPTLGPMNRMENATCL